MKKKKKNPTKPPSQKTAKTIQTPPHCLFPSGTSSQILLADRKRAKPRRALPPGHLGGVGGMGRAQDGVETQPGSPQGKPRGEPSQEHGDRSDLPPQAAVPSTGGGISSCHVGGRAWWSAAKLWKTLTWRSVPPRFLAFASRWWDPMGFLWFSFPDSSPRTQQWRTFAFSCRSQGGV